MKKHSALIVLFLVLSLFSVAEAAEYFVSPTGNDENPGTKEAPFLTITTGIEQLQAGDTLYLRGGEYYITSNVVMYTTQGTAENPIRIMNYNDENVIIKGCRSIGTDGWVQVDTNDANYEKYFRDMIGPQNIGNVYKKTIDYDIWDLFIDNKGQTLARWPNARDWSPEAWDQRKSRRGVTDEQTHTRITDHEAAFPGGRLRDLSVSLTGCGVGGGLSGFRDARTIVTDHVPGNPYFDHEYIPRITGKDGEKHWTVIRYYVAGLPVLDEEMEWAFDQGDPNVPGGTVYVWAPGGVSPDNFSTIDGRVVEHAFVGGPVRKGENFNNAPCFANATKHVTFDGLTFIGAAMRMSRTEYVTVQNCEFLYYGSHFFALSKADDPTNIDVFYSDHFRFINNIVKYGQSAAILTEGSKYLLIENNLFEHTAFGGTSTLNFGDVEFPILRYNTIRWSGGSTTVTFNNGANPPEIPEICEYNYIEHVGKFQSDGAAIQRIGRGAANFVFRYNWILHGGRMGIRCDFNKNPIILAHMYRNLIWDTKHNMGFNCEYANIFNNTSFDSFNGADMSYPKSQGVHFPNQNQFTISRNNLADRIEVTHPITVADSFWNGVDNNLLTRSMLRDVENKDFRPRSGAPVIDAGVEVAEVRWALPGIVETNIYETVRYKMVGLSDPQSTAYTNGHWTIAGPTDIATEFNGSAPDIGSYEYGDGNYFIPGRREIKTSHPIPLDGSVTAKPDCDLMWRTALNGDSYQVYFGLSEGSLALINTQTNNVFNPGALAYGQKYFWRVDTVTAERTISGDLWSFTVEPSHGKIRMEANTVSAGGDWTTVSLANTYNKPVVICTVNYNQNTVPVVARVRNAGATSFEVCLQNPSGDMVTTDTVHFMVVEEGVYRLPNGEALEARLITSDSVNYAGTNNWSVTQMERLDYSRNFGRPVIFGQVMTFSDPNWSVFWSRFEILPWWHTHTLLDNSYCYVGRHVGEDPNTSRREETLGVIIVESGIGEINGIKYEANRKDDKDAGVRGIDDKPPYTNKLINFDVVPQIGFVTQTGIDTSEPDGSWAVLHGANPLAADTITLCLDQDQIIDTERKVKDKQKYNYFVLEKSLTLKQPGQNN